jgi:hypothetical protein
VLLAYATKLTDTPGLVEDADIEALRVAGWDERGIWLATALESRSAADLPVDDGGNHLPLEPRHLAAAEPSNKQSTTSSVRVRTEPR